MKTFLRALVFFLGIICCSNIGFSQFSLSFDCGDNVSIEAYGKGGNDSTQLTLFIPDTFNIDSILVELAVKGDSSNFGTTTITTSAGEVVMVDFDDIVENIGSGEEAAIYRVWVQAASQITITNPSTDPFLEEWDSAMAYAVRVNAACVGGSASLEGILLFHACDTLIFPIPKLMDTTAFRNVSVLAPISDLGDASPFDPRSAIVQVFPIHMDTVMTEFLFIDTLLGFEDNIGNYLAIFETLIENLPGYVDTIKVGFQSAGFPGCLPGDGDSYVVGTVAVSAECDPGDCCVIYPTCPPDENGDCIAGITPIPASMLDTLMGTDSIDFVTLGGIVNVFLCDSFHIIASDDTLGMGCPGDPYVITRTFDFYDQFNNLDTMCTQVFTFLDSIPPMIMCPADITAECGALSMPFADFDEFLAAGGSASDNCALDSSSFVMISEVSDMMTCPETVTRMYEIADSCGLLDTCTHIVIIDDTTPPMITCPADVSFECDNVGSFGMATATDNCDLVVDITFSDVTVTDMCPRTIERTWVATDDCDNSSMCTQIIIIDDTTPPTLMCPSDVSFECDAVGSFGMATATDNCDLVVDVTFTDVTVNASCPQTIERTYTATDDCGNTSTCLQTIMIDDTTPPTIMCPSDVSFECDAVGAFGMATATDNCDLVVDITFSDVTISASCPQVIERTWVATDDCDNSSMCTQTIIIDDTTPPTIMCPSDVSFECDAVGSFGMATATDNCDLVVDITFSDVTVSASCPQVIERTWVATDDCGNSSICTQTIMIDDTTPPTIMCPSDVSFECDAVGSFGMATATDNCDLVVDITFSDVTITDMCPRTIERTWVATDDCDNSSMCTQIIIIDDTTPPTIMCPSDVSFECDAVGSFGMATATDNCDLVVDITFSDVTVTDMCPRTIERTWVATDDCDNSSMCTQIIIIDDTTPPTLMCPTDVSFECDAVGSFGMATATDNCDMVVDVTFTDVTVNASCPQTIERTYTATDDCGNTSTCLQTIMIDDTTPPTIMCPTDVSFECDAVGSFGMATATDNCDLVVDVTFTDVTVNASCPQIIERTYTATDDCGNTSTCLQTIMIDDTTPPTIMCPSDVSFECDAVGSFGMATATDNCDLVVDITFSDVTVADMCPQIIERTWSATDDCGNTSTCLQTIIIDDTTPPTVMCPADITAECGEEYEPGMATATDNCDLVVDVTFADVTISTSCPQVIERTYTATDDCGNTATCLQTITIDDTTPPTIMCPSDVSFECDAVGAFGMATATDACDPVVDITFSDVTVTDMCPRTIERTWVATDDCDNSSMCTQIIIIDDTTPPTLMCPSDVSFECDAVGSFGMATATDNCDMVVDVTFTDVTVSASCPQTIERTYTATDDCGNTSTCLQTILIDDTTPPVITCPADITAECDEMFDPGMATATDNCDLVVDVTFADVSVMDVCPIVVTTRMYTATDDCGNTSTCMQTITIIDSTPPVITCPADITAECGEMYDPGMATATDNCDMVVDITFTDVTVNASCPQVIERTYTATDDCDNTSVCTQTITIEDTTPPTIMCPSDVSFECDAVGSFGMASATDACDPVVDITFEDVTVNPGCPQVIERTYTATDDCGNTATCLQTITIDDTTPPMITCPTDVSFECDAVGDFGMATATDNCDLVVDVTFSDVTVSESCPQVIERTYTATDDCGNSSTCLQTIMIDDTTPPMITCPSDVSFECDAVGDFGMATATDNCDLVVDVTFSDVTVNDSCPLTIERTYTATDDCGNSSTCLQTIIIDDTTPPTIMCPADITAECGDMYDAGMATATDNCDLVVDVTFTDVTISDSCPQIIERTYTATDDCDNTSTCVQTITIDDTTPPVITCPADVTAECAEEYEPGMASATDACDPLVDITFEDVTVSASCPEVFQRIYTATDDCGNTSSCTQTITIEDTTPPTITCPADLTAECDEMYIVGMASATDACDMVVDITFEDVTVSASCPVIVERTYTATDDCGNSSTCLQTITIDDTTAPMITCPSDVSFECDAVGDYGMATATDNCDLVVDITFEDVTVSMSCPVIIERTYTATDDCGNSSTCLQTITIDDTTPPVITCPADITAECDDVFDPGVATATDNCDLVVDVTFADVSINDQCPVLMTTRLWTATDDCGNTSTCIQLITITDSTPPVIICPADITAECDEMFDAGMATATDACDMVVDITFTDVTVSESCPLIIERTYIATDDCGNMDTCVQMITIVDTTPPVITCPADITAECDEEYEPGMPTATDNCDLAVDITFEDVTVSASCPFTIERTYTATDDCGNTSTCVQTITIDDTIPPSIVCPADITAECDEQISSGMATATDNCDIAVDITFEDVTISASCPLVIERTYTATDDCGNTSTCVQTFTIVDTTPPMITCPADVSAECGEMYDAGMATATDACDLAVDVTFTDVTINESCPQIIERTWTATDDCENSTSCVQLITLDDITPPMIVCPPDMTVECSDVTVSGLQIVSGVPVAGITLAPAPTNQGGVAYNPIFDLYYAVRAGSSNYILYTYDATGTEISSVTAGFDFRGLWWNPNTNTLEGNGFSNGGYYVADLDGSGIPLGTGTAIPGQNQPTVQSVCDYDYDANEVLHYDNGTISRYDRNTTALLGSYPVVGLPVAFTNLNDNVVGYSGVPGSEVMLYDIVLKKVYFINKADGMYSAEVQLPASAPGPGSFNVSYSNNRIWITDGTNWISYEILEGAPSGAIVEPTVTDNCSDVTVEFTDEILQSEDCEFNYTIERTWTATDVCGNSSTCLQTIVVEDTTAPEIVCPDDLTFECTDVVILPADIDDFFAAGGSATDNCGLDSSSFTITVDSSAMECPLIITFTVSIDDLCGNSDTCMFTYEIFEPDTVDLSLTKVIDDGFNINPGDDVNYTITVSNDGNVPIGSVIVIDYIPLGMVLNDGDWTPGTDGSTGQSATIELTTFNGAMNLLPGESVSVQITLMVELDAGPGVYVNVAEIDFVFDTTGMNISDEDIDSDPDNDDTNDPEGEDDIDEAPFCIAPRPIIVGESYVCPGEVVTYTLGSDYNPAFTYNWAIQGGGGAIIENTDSTITVQWADVPGGPYVVWLTETAGPGCSGEADLPVYIEGLTDLACNDHINLSLDSSCSFQVLSGIILEGEAEGNNTFEVILTDEDGNIIPNATVTGEHIGQLITVKVMSRCNGQSCWGTLTVEDKIPPVIECIDVDLTCGASTAPVDIDPVIGTLTASATPGSQIGPDGGTVTEESFELSAPADAQVTDVNVTVDLTHTFSSDLDVFLVGPDGTSVELATDLCGATDDWTNLTFDDEASISVTAACNPNPPALTGSVQPEGSLSDFNGLSASGTWTLMITDDAGGDQGILIGASIEVSYFVALPYVPVATDGCGDVELTYTEEEIGEDCTGFQILRTWTATDESGNTSTCLQTITIAPLELATLTFPANYEGECGGSTSPTITGYPTVNGVEIGEQSCNLFTGYWDEPLQDCGGGTKILRTWTVVDWCTSEVEEGLQVIKLTDSTPPVITCPENITVGTDFWYCYANVSLPGPTYSDACGSAVTWSATADAGVLAQVGNYYVLNEAPIGVTTVTYTATDECGNSASCTFTVTVIDDVPPVPSCDEHTIVSLTNDGPYGLTLVDASVFDDGSYDNCGPVTFRARRMTSCIGFDWTTAGAGIDDIPNGIINSRDRGTILRPKVPFACCDVAAGPIMVELEVTDAAGNVNFCMVEVEVQDKLAPFITCPPNIVVSCDFWFDDDVVLNQFVPATEAGLGVFGAVLDAYDYNDDQSARQPIIIDDPGDNSSSPINWGIDGWADDNCDVVVDVRTRITDDCSGEDLPADAPANAVRRIERTFRAVDGQGNTNNCQQIIYVVDFDPFDINDITWPRDIPSSGCNLDDCPMGELTPENLQGMGLSAACTVPRVNDDNCSLIGMTYTDTRFDFVEGACYKILREWSVIDWCQYDVNTGAGIWHHTQVIKVLDTNGPAFEDCPQGPVTLCVEDAGVELPANNQVFLGEGVGTSCSVHVSIAHTVTETCSDIINYDVKIYPFNGTSYIYLQSPTTISVENGQATLTASSKTAPLLSVRQDGLPYNSPWCGDYHRVLISAEDGCGNASTCEYLVRLEDCKKPTPVCINGLSTVVMPSNGEVTIWAKDYNASSYDDCTPAADLLYSFSGDTYQPSMVYSCDNVPAFGAELSVEVWVADGGVDHNCNNQIEWSERNKDFCTTTIVITDNNDVCGNDGGMVSGEVQTHDSEEAISSTMIELTSPSGYNNTFMTDATGQYTFTNVPTADAYTIRPERNDDHMNGVSTLDLVRIQKHLLGTEPFTTPYQYIAADANNSESVSAIDLIEIRKLILGIYTEYPNNTSWRFVDKGFTFDNPQAPWPFGETIDIESLSGDIVSEDFMGMKIGDLNNTVQANATQIEIRGAREEVKVKADAQRAERGEEVSVTITIPAKIVGFQWTLDLDGLAYTGIESATAKIGDGHVGIHRDQLTMSYARTESDEDVVFTLNFRAEQSGELSEMISVSSDITEAEAYDASEEIYNIDIEFVNQDRAQEFALYQNEPNPFRGQTMIGFVLPAEALAKEGLTAMPVTLNIFDELGQLVKEIKGDYSAGYNKIEIDRKDLPATGVVYYHLQAGEFMASKKMILIE